MRLVYDATGRKWFKRGEFGVTGYASGIEYLDGKLEAIYAPDGRMVAEYTGGQITRYRAEYFHQDHLGNTRLVFSDFNQNGIVDLEEDDPATPLNELEFTQESHYYPFGMNHLGPWYETVAPENKYLYNGKELNGDYEINLMDYGARWYDGAIGRWTAVDPLAEEYYPWSPYNYTLGNPIRFIDPDGRSIDNIIIDTDGNETKEKEILYDLQKLTNDRLDIVKGEVVIVEAGTANPGKDLKNGTALIADLITDNNTTTIRQDPSRTNGTFAVNPTTGKEISGEPSEGQEYSANAHH